MLERVGSRTGFALGTAEILRFLADGLFGLVFAYGAGWRAVYVVGAVLLCALLLARSKRAALGALLLPFLAIAFVLVAVSAGVKAHMFAARYLIPASPFLSLAVAWALATLWGRSRWLGVTAVLVVVLSALPTISNYVYAKPYEVSGSFDPTADYRFLYGRTLPDDVVFFNILSLAGQYERLRTPSDPTWSFVQRWDPVIEPLETALEQRVLPALQRHHRLWFVLYKGTVAANLALKDWLDHNSFPALGQWREDTLYLLYLSPTGSVQQWSSGAVFDGTIRLRSAEYTARTGSDGCIGVSLVWSAEAALERNYKVFVHLYTSDGRLVAQHDAVPVNELRPTPSWLPGEQIADRHGMWVPPEIRGSLRLAVGLYDPETNTRLKLSSGADLVDLGLIELAPGAATRR
jgi:hypothetical protein